MYSFKKSVIALVGVLLLVGALALLMPLLGRGQGQGQAPFAKRMFYLTQTQHNGGQALSACAEGYHMASIWEIHDPSNLQYNTELGFRLADSGVGPPSGSFTDPDLALPAGWVRTGQSSSTGTVTGVNCFAWTDPAGSGGTIVYLEHRWELANPPTVISPWGSRVRPCSSNWRVWCLQD